MQLAFVTILVIILLFPGIAFRLGYLRRDGLVSIFRTSVYFEILIVIFLSVIFHSCSWYIFEEYSSYDFKIDLLYNFIQGKSSVSFEDKETLILRFLAYNFIFSLILFCLGLLINRLLTSRKFRFPRDFDFLDYTGNWEHIINDSKSKNMIPVIDALVEINDKSFIYSGVLIDYYIDSKGYLDKLILEKVYKTELKSIHQQGTNRMNNIVKPVSNSEVQKEIDLLSTSSKDLLGKLEESFKEQVSEYVEYSSQINTHHFVIYGSSIKNVGIRYEDLLDEKDTENEVRVIKKNDSQMTVINEEVELRTDEDE